MQQVIFRRGEFARAEMMRRNYCIREGELVKRFSKEDQRSTRRNWPGWPALIWMEARVRTGTSGLNVHWSGGIVPAVAMSSAIVYETCLLVAVCVLSLFLFPASAGPYPAVHGPATALQAAQSSTQLQLAMASGPKSFIRPLVGHMVASSPMPACDSDLALLTSLPTSVLRC